MLPDVAVAACLGLGLLAFYGTSLHNLIRSRKAKKGVRYEAEVEMPRGLVFGLAAFGTLVFFVETAFYIVLVLSDVQSSLTTSVLQLHFPYNSSIQAVGILSTFFGYFLFCWSVIARGRYATSWEMSEDHRLVTWGPYRYVRHPSYLAYFILFAGQLLALLNLIAIIPFLAVPGYVGIASREEELLKRRFGSAYVEYQRRTGKFLPRRKTESHSSAA
jgi:protein-S-isoprenylcysteine O-methyltransferase Ste14